MKHSASMKNEYQQSTAAARRLAHFAAGGTTATWRGRAACLDESTSKARVSKQACRKRTGWC